MLNRAFIVRSLIQNRNAEAVSQVLVHYCWEHWVMAQQVLGILLDAVHKYDEEELHGFLTAIFILLGQQDSLRHAKTQFFMERFIAIIRKNLKYAGATKACILFLMRLAKNNNVCSSWMCAHRSMWSWIEETVQTLNIDFSEQRNSHE